MKLKLEHDFVCWRYKLDRDVVWIYLISPTMFSWSWGTCYIPIVLINNVYKRFYEHLKTHTWNSNIQLLYDSGWSEISQNRKEVEYLNLKCEFSSARRNSCRHYWPILWVYNMFLMIRKTLWEKLNIFIRHHDLILRVKKQSHKIQKKIIRYFCKFSYESSQYQNWQLWNSCLQRTLWA